MSPLPRDAFPELAKELAELLRAENESDLGNQVDGLRIVDRCRCGDHFCATDPKFFFDGRFVVLGEKAYDIAPDGRFVMIQEAELASDTYTTEQINIVQNWFEELKRLVATGK